MLERLRRVFSKESPTDIPRELKLSNDRAMEIIRANDLDIRVGIAGKDSNQHASDLRVMFFFTSDRILRDRLNALTGKRFGKRMYSFLGDLEKRKHAYMEALHYLNVVTDYFIAQNYPTEEEKARAHEIGNAVNDLFTRGRKRFDTGFIPHTFHIEDLKTWERDWKPRIQRQITEA